MSFKGTFQPNPIYDSVIINWKSVVYEMLINTYSSWNTFLASITRSSNPIHTEVLPLLWTHTPSALPFTHCSCGSSFSYFLWEGWAGPVFPSLPWLLWALWSHVWPCISTQSGWWESPHDPKQLGVGGVPRLPMLPARNGIHSEVPASGVCQGFSTSTTTFHSSFLIFF